MGSHGAAYATNCRTEGRTPGSSSNVPIRIPIDSGWAGLEPNSADPHSSQSHFSPPLSGLQTRSLSSPATIRNDPGAGCACAEAAVPLRRCAAARPLLVALLDSETSPASHDHQIRSDARSRHRSRTESRCLYLNMDPGILLNGAAPESNRPSRGLHDRTGLKSERWPCGSSGATRHNSCHSQSGDGFSFSREETRTSQRMRCRGVRDSP